MSAKKRHAKLLPDRFWRHKEKPQLNLRSAGVFIFNYNYLVAALPVGADDGMARSPATRRKANYLASIAALAKRWISALSG